MGVFRVLSELGALEIVDMFSSVSGGTWFLTKLAFDNDFSTKVLSSKDSIAEVVMEWMESEYFRAFRDVKRTEGSSDDPNLKRFLTTVISQGPDALKAAVGPGIVAFDHFDFSWQNFVENTILGLEVANTELAKATVVNNTLSKFGKDFDLAFNWYQQNKFEDEIFERTFFLKDTNGQHVQYPAYASAVYEHKSACAKPEVNVLMRAQHPSNIFQICSQNTADETYKDWIGRSKDKTPEEIAKIQTCNDFKFDFSDLTIGQATSASSAAAGPAASHTWVQSIFEFARIKAHTVSTLQTYTGSAIEKFATCGAIKTVLQKAIGPCQQDVVLDEIYRILNCNSEDSSVTAKRWSHFLRKLAIKFKMSSDKGETAESYMAFDAVGRHLACTCVHRGLAHSALTHRG